MAQTQGGIFMKQLKQLTALFLAFALVIGVFSQPTVAYAEESLAKTDLTSDKVAISYTEERLKVTKTAGETVYYTLKWTETTHAKTAWEEAYEESDILASIDFSNVSASKIVNIFLTTDTDKEPLKIELKAQETALYVDFSGIASTTEKSKVKVAQDWTDMNAITKGYKSFNPTSENPWTYGYLNVSVGKLKPQAITASEAALYLQFRKGATGAWQDFEDLDVRKYAAYGAQLTFRIRPYDNPSVSTGSALANLGRASKEVKVTYKKQANAPKITINGVNKELKLVKTQEYRVFTTSGSSVSYGPWMTVAANHMTGTKVNKVYLKDLYIASGTAWSYKENTAGQGLQVRIAASAKSTASKVTTIKLNQATTPTATTDGAIVFGLVSKTTYDKGITAKNTNATTGSSIQVAVVSGSPIDVNDTKVVKWVTILPGKTATISGTVLKTGNNIIYRNATAKDNTRTSANEFVVSSEYGTYEYKTKLPLAEQTFAISNPVISATVVGATRSAIVTATAGAYEVEVTTTTNGAFTVALTVATTNVVDCTPVIACVAEATDSSASGTASTKVKLLTDGGIKSGAGKLKITVTADATTETKIYRVTTDGKKTYVTVKFTKQL